MLGGNMMLKLIKPMLPKLVGFMDDNSELEEGEIKKSILINTIDNQIRIDVVALKEVNGNLCVSRIIKSIGQDEFLDKPPS